MSKDQKQNRPKARLAKGFRDVGPAELRGLKEMLRTIERVYESYGFEPVEQPFIEYTDALGKFLPDQDRPNEGVFSFQDDDDQWLSLRYDLTAPLARYVAENQQSLPMPYRSYRQGWVFRNEKPGPGRFRQFMQFDADTVGAAYYPADAEVCMMAADTMEALGIERGQYVVRVSSRKVLDGIMETLNLAGDGNASRRMEVYRALDAMDRIGIQGVKERLGKGRKDESGDFKPGVGLSEETTNLFIDVFRNMDRDNIFLSVIDGKICIQGLSDVDRVTGWENVLKGWNDSGIIEVSGPPSQNKSLMNIMFLQDLCMNTTAGRDGIGELLLIMNTVRKAGYGEDRIRISPSVVRGLEYYTGPVFECELLTETKDDDGRPIKFGSVGGGGRYDNLVARFTGQQVPATGFSIGVSRLYAALKFLGKAKESSADAPVVVLVMDRERIGDYQRMVANLRSAGVRAEMYLGTSGMKAQMKYADKRGSPLVVIQGGDEKAKGEVQIKDLALGAKLAQGVESREDYASQRLAQYSVPEAEFVDAVKKALGR